jgi:hypothetical protein
LVILLAERMPAQTLSLSPTSIAPNTTHNYFSGFSGGTDSQAFTFGTPSIRLVDYNTIQISVNAPQGQAWNVAYAGQGFNNASLNFNLAYYVQFPGPYASITADSWTFNYVKGSSASLNNYFDSTLIPTSGDRLDVQMGYKVVDDLEFTGFTINFTYDNTVLDANSLYDFQYSQLSYQFQPSSFSAPDPGAELTLQPTPEPSTLALGILGGLGVLFPLLRPRSKFQSANAV